MTFFFFFLANRYLYSVYLDYDEFQLTYCYTYHGTHLPLKSLPARHILHCVGIEEIRGITKKQKPSANGIGRLST